MDERELDRAIDAAAGRMMAREPGRALSHNVMARVREGAAPAPRRLVWIAAAASIVLCAAIATALMIGPAAVVPLTPDAPSMAFGQPDIATLPPMTVALETPSAHRNARATIAARSTSPAPPPPSDVSPIAPIETEPIVLSTIDVPVLERDTAVIDVLNIEPLTIEPLSASND
jgi:hypothetical protein